MAAYAAVLSLRHTIDHLQNHPHPPISLHISQIQSLTQILTLFQDFLENYSLNSDGLESLIADAAHEPEDVIESHVVDRNQARSLNPSSSYDESLFQGLQRVIESMNFIAKDVKETMKQKADIRKNRPRLNPHPPSPQTGSSRSPPMVGFDDVMVDVMDKLTCHSTDRRRVITITGMGGMGKTTLARNVFTNPLVEQHFDILSWATISQEYCLKEILLEFLVCSVNHQVSKEHFNGKSEDELRLLLHKALSGRRYLVVMDDVWSLDAWDEMKFFFPQNNNGSRVMVTTRLSNVAFQLSDDSSHCIKMSFLDKDQSWILLSKTVFGEEEIRPGGFELEEIGKKIAENCRGLPLSIVVIGGLLAKSEQKREYWLHVAENLNSTVNFEDNESCFKILHLSYRHLPIHLKPCFLYTGVFQEDAKIRVSSLIKFWVSEGFVKVKSIGGECSEIIALHYLKELTDRNLISVHERGPAGNIKICTCHDLLRDLCVKEAQKQKLLNFINLDDTSADTSNNRRICFAKSIPRYSFSTYDLLKPKIPNTEAEALLSSPHVRSLMCDSLLLVSSVSSKLLRVIKADDRLSLPFYDSPKDIFGLVNLRLLDVRVNWHEITDNYLSSLHLLWNLQTLIVEGPNVTLPNEFWKMTQLRHVKFRRLELPEPPGTDLVVLGHLQTLKTVCNLKFSEEVVKRIPNIKKLKLNNNNNGNELCLENIGCLHKLESLYCVYARKIEFPSQLKKLTLQGNEFSWEDEMMTRIGSLPNLEVLKLKRGSFVGPAWETVEGHFCSLKFLLIEQCLDLEWWNTESSHFPILERLVLRYLGKLKEIPLGIGNITTLKSIELEYCSDLAVISANEILKEQEEMGNEDLRVRIQVQPWEKSIYSR